MSSDRDSTWRTCVASSMLGVLIALGVVSCGIVISFDDFGTRKPRAALGDGGLLYTVSGNVDGLFGAKATLRLRELTLDAGDGPFTFPASVPDGADYAVTVATDTNGHACTVERGGGRAIHADVTDIAVHCPSTDATLANLALSAGALAPAFAATTLTYSARASVAGIFADPLTSTMVMATASDARAHISIAGTPTISGQAAAALPLNSGTNPIDIAVTAADGRTTIHYTIVVAAVVNDYVKASNTRANSNFGVGLALSGDTLAVGAPSESSGARGVNGDQGDTSALDAGAVYVFRRIGSAWTQEAYIKASNTHPTIPGYPNSAFGAAVGLSGDTLVVGAPFESSLSTGVNGDQSGSPSSAQGAVYVFVRSGATWSQQAFVKASNAVSTYFGAAVAVAGDTFAVGSPFESSCATGVGGEQTQDPACNGSGAAYVFTRAGTTWSQQAYVKPSNTQTDGRFGVTLSLFGDTLAVGATGDSSNATGVNGNQADTSAPQAGAAYVFTRTGSTWSQQAYVKASNTRAAAQFGATIAVSADTLAVGSPGESSNATGINGDQADSSLPYSGAVYIFRGGGASWSQEAYLKASNNRVVPPSGAAFFGGRGFSGLGVGLSLLGDHLAVGAFAESGYVAGVNQPPPSESVSVGAAYVFFRKGTTWSERAYVKASNPRPQVGFGASVAVSVDTLVVGAELEQSSASGLNGNQLDSTAPGAGAVYIY